MPTRLPSESLNHAASPPPGIRARPFSVRVSGVSYSSNSTPRPLISLTAARTSVTWMTACVNFPWRPDPGGIDEELVDAISDREADLPISCLEKVGLGRLKSHFLNVERFGSVQVLRRQCRRDRRCLHDRMV